MRLVIAVICGITLASANAAAAKQNHSSHANVQHTQAKGEAAQPGAQHKQTANDKKVAGAAPEAMATAAVRDAQGKEIGTVAFKQVAHGVLMTGNLTGLPQGPHAIHIHEVGQCEPPFKSAGGHFNPGGKQHGMDNPKGMHAGDLPNIDVDKEGMAKFEMFLPSDLSLMPGKKGYLFDKDGSAIVVHAGPDDYRTDPAGGAGDRIACGVIQPQKM